MNQRTHRWFRCEPKSNMAFTNRPELALQQGQAMVEFAFVFSIFILLFFGFLGLAFVFFSWLTTASAAREGARYVISNPSASDTEINQYICSTSAGLGGGSTGCNSALSTGDLQITTEPSAAGRIANAQVSVTVRYRVPVPTLTVPFLDGSRLTFLGPIWVSSVAVMRIDP